MENLSYGFWLLVAVTVAYCGIAVDLWGRGNWPLALCFAGYSLANIGMLVAIK